MNNQNIQKIPRRLGTCQNMCPENERRIREKEGLLHIFEKSDTNPKKADPLKIIKSFNRSAAGQQLNKLSDLRPPEILRKTIEYMVYKIMTKKDIDWIIVYDYIFDRTRAIRQDMIIQNLNPLESLKILEIIVKFHIYSAYRLCELPETKFDKSINMQHLFECIKRCLVFYDQENNENTSNRRSEMEQLYLLSNLGNPIILNRAFDLPPDIRNPNVQTALEISLAYYLGNYYRVCKLIQDLPLVSLLLVALELPKIRRKALYTMSIAYSSKNLFFSASELKELLLYNDVDQVLNECKYYNIQTNSESILFKKGNFNLNIKLSQSTRCLFVDNKINNITLTNILIGNKEC